MFHLPRGARRRAPVVLAVALAVVAGACGDTTATTAPTTTPAGTPSTATAPEGDAAGHGAGSHGDTHSHGEPLEVSGWDPVPTVTLSVTPDAVSGFNIHVEVTGLRFAPEHASGAHVDGEGHAHLYVDGVKVARLYGPWFHLGPLDPGTHVIEVRLSSNDHRDLVADGEPVADTVEVTVGDGPTATPGGPVGDGSHGAAGEDGGDTAETVTIRVAGGEVVGGVQRHRVPVGATVVLVVEADLDDEVHLHTYDLTAPVVDGRAELRFVADIPGIHEVELEHAGIRLAEIQVG